MRVKIRNIENNHTVQNKHIDHTESTVHMTDILPQNKSIINHIEEEEVTMEIDIDPSHSQNSLTSHQSMKHANNSPTIIYNGSSLHDDSSNNSPEITNTDRKVYMNDQDVQKMESDDQMHNIESDGDEQTQGLKYHSTAPFLSDALLPGSDDFTHKNSNNTTSYMLGQHLDKYIPLVEKGENCIKNNKILPLVKPKCTIEVTWQCRFCPYKTTYLQHSNQTKGLQKGYNRTTHIRGHKRKKITCYYKSHLHEM